MTPASDAIANTVNNLWIDEVKKRPLEKSQEALAAFEFGALINLLMPILMQLILDKLGQKSKQKVTECAKELGWWQQTQLRMLFRREVRVKKHLGISKSDVIEASDIVADRLIALIQDEANYELLEEFINEAEANSINTWKLI
tara:strand:+ start:1230 stop:1658 length:429 start_codon:yes stop_codon:yes gene_type:complete